MAFSKITTKAMSGDTLEAGDIAANSIGASELADNAVDTAAIASGAVTAPKVVDGLIEVKPHIKPGTLYPAWRGLIDGHTGYTFTDSSATPKTITSVGTGKASHHASQKKFGSTSIYFDGVVGDYLEITDHADFTFGTGNFTIEFFVNMGDQAGAYHTLFHSANHDVRVTIGASATAPTLSFYSDTWDAHTSGTTDIGDNAWHHCAIVREGTNLKLYVDGALEATRASSGNSLDPDNIRIGQYATSLPFKGFIDDVRITKGLAVYTGNFTAPTSALTTTWSAGTNIAANSTASNVSFLMHSDAGGNSGAYGTAQSDGRSYYYTDIKGSKPIKDPRIGAHFGSQRHKAKSLQLLEQETATNGTNVYSVDGREWMRAVDSSTNSWSERSGSNGQYIWIFSQNLDGTAFMEITGYFNFSNFMGYNTTSSSPDDMQIFVNGGSEVSTVSWTTTGDQPLKDRYVDAASSVKLNLGTITAPQITTLKIAMNDSGGGGHHARCYAIELITQDTTDTASKSKIQIPAQNVVSYGKKHSVSAAAQHYNPFNGMSGAKTLSELGTYIDTGTSLGMDNWKGGTSNYYKPFNGGRVVKWVDSSGNIKTSVTMMPPNAQNHAQTASNAVSNGEVQAGTNGENINFNADGIDHSLSEVAKTFFAREFGNGAANTGGGGNWADASMLQNTDDIGYVMDDGLTSVWANDVEIWGTPATTLAMAATSADNISTMFMGTGVSLVSHADGTTRYHSTIALNLPYGSHLLRQERTGNTYPNIWVNGISIVNSSFNSKGAFEEITFHQPKMPPIPEDACIIADYMLMADFVAHATQSSADAYMSRVSKGTRWVSASRDWFYLRTDNQAYILDQPTPNAVGGFYVYIDGACDSDLTAQAKLPCFGTNFISRGYDVGNRHRLYVDDVSKTRTDFAGAYLGSATRLATNLELGVHTFQSHGTTGQNHNFNGCEIVTPIHTSHHYQPFETPFQYELVGGDRNMEQNNLIVTPDGKSWDEVTRDTSYIGGLVLQANSASNQDWTNIVIMTRWRGGDDARESQHLFNKDFAIAYNRMICLKTGFYRFVVSSGAHGAGEHLTILKNGVQTHNSYSPTNDDAMTLNVVLNCMRGDYLQVKGSWRADMTYQSFHIEKA